MRIEIIQKYKLDEFDFTKFGLEAMDLEKLNALDLSSKLPFIIPFKTTTQMSGTTGGDVIKTSEMVPDKYTSKLRLDEIVIKGVKVGASPTRQYGVILCETWENLIAIIISNGYRTGVIVFVPDVSNLKPSQIPNLPSFNPAVKSTKLLKFATTTDLDKIAMLDDQAIKAIWSAVMKTVNGIVKPEDSQPTPNDNIDYRKQLVNELRSKGIVFAKNASTPTLEKLLRGEDPTNEVLPKLPNNPDKLSELKKQLDDLSVAYPEDADVDRLTAMLKEYQEGTSNI